MSVAESLRVELAAKLKLLSVEERIELSLELGRRDLALHVAKSSCTPAEARRRFVAQRKAGRVPSSSADR